MWGPAGMNARALGAVSFLMTIKNPTSREKEVQALFARGKSAEVIAIRLGLKVSKVLALLADVPKPPATASSTAG